MERVPQAALQTSNQEAKEINMKPIIILPPDAVTAEDIQILRDNDLCVVVAKDPATVKFVDPIPSASSRTEIENAAIQLSRRMLAGELQGKYDKANVSSLYVDILLKGTPLDADQLDKETHTRQWFNTEYFEEVKRLAREEAREDRKKRKEEAAAKKTEVQKAS